MCVCVCVQIVYDVRAMQPNIFAHCKKSCQIVVHSNISWTENGWYTHTHIHMHTWAHVSRIYAFFPVHFLLLQFDLKYFLWTRYPFHFITYYIILYMHSVDGWTEWKQSAAIVPIQHNRNKDEQRSIQFIQETANKHKYASIHNYEYNKKEGCIFYLQLRSYNICIRCY